MGAFSVQQLLQIGDHHIGPTAPQIRCMPGAVDPDDVAKTPCAPGGHSRECILVHRRLRRRQAQRSCSGEEAVGCRLPTQTFPGSHDTVDAYIYQRCQAARRQHLGTVNRGGDDGRAQAGILDRVQVAHRPGVDRNAVFCEFTQEQLVFALAQAVHRGRVGGTVGTALRQDDASAGKEVADAVGAGFAVDVAAVVVRG